jgi:hypothetical protein
MISTTRIPLKETSNMSRTLSFVRIRCRVLVLVKMVCVVLAALYFPPPGLRTRTPQGKHYGYSSLREGRQPYL